MKAAFNIYLRFPGKFGCLCVVLEHDIQIRKSSRFLCLIGGYGAAALRHVCRPADGAAGVIAFPVPLRSPNG